MSIPHIKQHLNRFIQDTRGSQIGIPAAVPQTGPVESKQAPALGRIGASPSGQPGRPVRGPGRAAPAFITVFLLAMSVPYAGAQSTPTTGDFGGTLTSPFAVSASAPNSMVDVNINTGEILVSYLEEAGATDPCRIAISADDGTTWLPDKQISVGSSGAVCEATWFDDDTIIIPVGPSFMRSDNRGISFSTITPGGACGGTVGQPAGQFIKVDDNYWGYLCGDGDFAWTNNAGASWTTSDPVNSIGRIAYRGTTGSWIALMTGINSVQCTTDDFASVTGGGVQYTTQIVPSFNTRSFQYVDGEAWIPGTFPGAQSLFSGSTDVGFAVSANCGGTWTSHYAFIFDSDGQGMSGGTNWLDIADNGKVYYSFRQTGNVRTLLGQYDENGWEWKIVEDLAAVTNKVIGGHDTSGSTIYMHVYATGGANFNQFLYGPVFGISNANQIPVNDLTQADVDNTGTIIIARVDAGETIETYNANTLGILGTDATPDCAIYAGVSSIRTSVDYFVSYGACDATGNVDTLWVKSENLGTPSFPEGCSTEFCQEENNQFDTIGGAPFDVPADIHALGTISAIPYSFEASPTSGLPNGYASWTFSTLSGEIGALGVSYNQNGPDNGDRVLVNVNPGGDIHAFCSWRNPANDQDYIAGVSDGPTVIAEVSATAQQAFIANDDTVDVDANVVIQNTVPYGEATGISCTLGKYLVDTSSNVYLVNITEVFGVTTDQVSWVVPKTGFTLNEIAISPSGLFAAWRDGNDIRVSHVENHTSILTLPVPTGTWRGIEMDQKGGRVFVYTSDFITIYDVSEDTCKLNCSASENEFAEPLPGAGGDDGGETDDGGSLGFIGNPYFWILMALLVVEVIIAALSWSTRAGFGGTVYLVGGMVVYIIGMIIDQQDGVTEVSPWPLVVIVATVIGLAIAGFVKR